MARSAQPAPPPSAKSLACGAIAELDTLGVDAEMRAIAPDEFPAFHRAVDAAFGHHSTDAETDASRKMVELDRTIAVYDRGAIVATAGAFTMQLTMPGGATVPTAGVTAVSVATSHRRRGLLTQMMRAQLDDVATRQEPVAVLTASESVIYGRFGYGLAASFVSVRLAQPNGGFLRPLDDPGGCRAVDVAEAGVLLPQVFDRYRAGQHGELTRNDAYWDHRLTDIETWREGASAYFHVVHEDERGLADGYLTYRMRDHWSSAHLPASTVEIDELIAVDDRARSALWRFASSIDLASAVRSFNVPVDDPLRWELADPRRLEVTALADHLWVRVLDAPAAFSARTYRADGRLVLDVSDHFRPGGAADGRFEIEAGPAGARCRPTDDPADLAVPVAELGAVLLGGVAATTLHRAGRVGELRPGALARADAMLVTAPAPFCATHF